MTVWLLADIHAHIACIFVSAGHLKEALHHPHTR